MLQVHERGVDADLLSLVIKLLMQHPKSHRRQGLRQLSMLTALASAEAAWRHCCPTVKLVVMSATLQVTNSDGCSMMEFKSGRHMKARRQA